MGTERARKQPSLTVKFKDQNTLRSTELNVYKRMCGYEETNLLNKKKFESFTYKKMSIRFENRIQNLRERGKIESENGKFFRQTANSAIKSF